MSNVDLVCRVDMSRIHYSTQFKKSSTSFLSYHFLFKFSMTNCRKHPISHRKGYIHFWCKMIPSSKKWSCPQKLCLAVILENIAFFEKTNQWKIFRTSFSAKKRLLIFVARCPLLLKPVMSFHKWFFHSFFPRKYCRFWKTCLMIKYLVPNPCSRRLYY